jgi:hypothetical protein
MKSFSGTPNFVLLAIALVLVVACATVVGTKNGGIIYGKERDVDYVIIRPKAQLSQVDCDSLNVALRKYNNHLYRIQTYAAGKRISETGQLDLNRIQHGLAYEVANEAKTMGLTGCGLAAGNSCTKQNITAQRKELLGKLEPILKRYIK